MENTGLRARDRGRALRRRLTGALAAALLWGLPTASAAQAGTDSHERACARGNASSCALLALAYERGAVGGRDPQRAATLYERACTGGVTAACTSLGVMYQSGVGVSRDLARAAELFEVACAQGDDDACALGVAVAETAEPAQWVTGRVEDESGTPLVEAIVEVPALGLVAISDGSGRVDFGLLPVGRHEVRAERLGYLAIAGMLEVTRSAEFVIVLTPAPAEDPNAPGRIVGRVVDADSGDGLADVQITLPGAASTLSGGSGSFVVRDVEPGLHRIQFERLGYGTQTTSVIVQPGGVVDVAARMSTRAIELDPVAVTVEAFDRQGFEARARAGWGTQFSPDDLDRIRPQRVSDIVRTRVRGVTTVTDYLGTRVVSRRSVSGSADTLTAMRRLGAGADSSDIRAYLSSAQYCSLSVYLDGMPMQDFDIDALDPRTIEALEVYHGAGTPIQYLGNHCGAVLIWTRRGR